MADNVQTDSDAGPQSQPGVGRSDQTTKALHELNPNWLEDGHGVRGPQRQVATPQNARPRRMEFAIDNSRNSPSAGSGGITVTTEDASGYSPGSGISQMDGVTTLTFDSALFEIFDGGGGQCVVRGRTTDCSA